MLAELERAVEELEVPIDGAALAEVFALRARLDAAIAGAVAEFDRLGLWELDGATSAVAWLRARCGLSGRAAARVVSVSRRTAALPATAAAWRSGALGEGQVEAIVANVSPSTVDTFAAQELELVGVLAPLSVTDTARAMSAWAARADEGAAPSEPERRLHLSPSLDGRWVLDGDLDVSGGETVSTALRLAQSSDATGERRLPTERRADALVDVCRHYLDHCPTTGGGRHRPHLNVVVDAADMAAGGGGHFVDGSPLDAASVACLLCDASVHRVVMRGRSAVIDYGHATRTVPAPLWNALVVRDEHCRFPGCDRPAQWCEGHHVRWYSNGGPTNLPNLVLLCSRHHHRLHQGGWSSRLGTDAIFEVTDPGGAVHATLPPRALPLRC